MPLVGDAGGSDVDVARGAVGAHLEADLREVGLAEQQQDLPQAVDAEIVVLVVRIDDRVQGLDGGEGLHGLVRAAEVGADLLAHGHQVGSGLLVVLLQLARQLIAKAHELRIELV